MDWEKNSFEIINALVNPILIIDCNYRVVGANKAACRSFCSSLDRIVGQKCFKVTHKVNSPCWDNGTNCPVREAIELKDETRIIHNHDYAGKPVIEEIIAVPLFDDKGEVKFIIEELNDMTELVQSKEIIQHLKSEINTLRGIIPICSSCKKIRDDSGFWQQVEVYVRDRSEANFSHSYCPECAEKLFPDFVRK